MEMAINMNMNMGFLGLTDEELLMIDGGVNWDRVFAGAAVYLGATLAVASMTTPIGWGVAATYLVTCAASGAYIGYGLGTN